ncbi:MAG: acetyl-CoA carboxylase carboxyltransferase subunit alpha [Candidatus Methylacidiphilales bacterium]
MRTIPLEFEKPIVDLEKMLGEIQQHSNDHKLDFQSEVQRLEKKIQQTREEIYAQLTPWQRVQIVRHPQRPFALDYIKSMCSEFIELQGDRVHGDDKALIGGLATIEGERMMIIGHQKGRDTRENLMRNFGCAHPEGYRKALRLMKMADRFHLPILSLIDTPGAFPGIPSEERHIAEAIAVNIRDMFTFKVPMIAVVIGEGGSGGALGIGVADRVLILENAYYSVISPEGCASILWKDRSYAPDAAEALKMTAPHLMKLGVVDELIPEPSGGAHKNWEVVIESVKAAVLRHLAPLKKIKPTVLIQKRYERFRAFGPFTE